MTLLEFLHPGIFWKNLKKVTRDIQNRHFYGRKMRELEENGTLKQFGMRLDMRSRAYYVLNLEPETLMMGAESLELEKSRVLESINVRKGIFETAELTELIEAKTERIKNAEYYAYLIQIKYRPISNLGHVSHVLGWMICSSFAMTYAIKAIYHKAEILNWILEVIA